MQPITKYGSLATLLLLGSSSPALAQTELYTLAGALADDVFGTSVAAAGDVDNDGFPDFVVGASEDNDPFGAREGYATVYTGRTGGVLWTLDGAGFGDGFGTSVGGAGDVNNDGHDDVVVGAPFAGSGGAVYVFSGFDATPLLTYVMPESGARLGVSVGGAGDVNDDGFDDVIAGANGSTAGGSMSGRMLVLSGQTGLPLYDKVGALNDQLGTSVAGVGDLNADQHDDFVVGSRLGGVRVYSGIDGSVLHHWTVASLLDSYGRSVASAGDIDGDQVQDIIIGAPQDIDFFFPGTGYAQVRSGATGGVLHTLNGINVLDSFGSSVGGAGDFDADGTNDMIVGADELIGGGTEGYAQIFSGTDGSVIATIDGDAALDRFGHAVAGIGDTDGDLRFEVVIGAPTADPNNDMAAGIARVFAGEVTVGCADPVNFCTAVPNSTGQTGVMSWSGSLSVASNNLQLIASQLPASQTGLFIYSPDQTQQPLGNGNLCIGNQTLGFVLRLPPEVSDVAGLMTHALDITQPSAPEGQITAGSTWNFSCWHRDNPAGGAGFNFADGMQVTFCP